MKTPIVRRVAAVEVMAALGASGQLARFVPPQPVSDITRPLHDTAGSVGKVLYLDFVVARTPGDPGLPVGYGVTGDVTYQAAGGDLARANEYARGSLEKLPGSCTQERPGLVVCDLGTEARQKIGSMTFVPGAPVPFDLGGLAFTAAVKAGTVYYGLEVLQGQARAGESLEITNTLLRAR